MITSGIYNFSKIIESVRQETGITNLTNNYVSIRKMIFDALFDINPWGGLLVRKRMIYYKGNGNFDGKNIKKPADFVMLDKMGCCRDKLCKLYETVSHFVICDNNNSREKVAFTYWSIQCDGEGNPVVTNNHAPAVVAYIVWKMYSPKVFMGEGNVNVKKDYEIYYGDRALEARGHDSFPSDESMYKMRKMAAMTSKELDASFCTDHCSDSSCMPTYDDEILTMTNKVWYWQYDSLTKKINSADDITDEFLEEQFFTTLPVVIAGMNFNYATIGRIGFCIEDVDPDDISIYDIIGSDTRKTFDYFYDFEKRRLVVISNDYISQSTIYFKFKHNG